MQSGKLMHEVMREFEKRDEETKRLDEEIEEQRKQLKKLEEAKRRRTDQVRDLVRSEKMKTFKALVSALDDFNEHLRTCSWWLPTWT